MLTTESANAPIKTLQIPALRRNPWTRDAVIPKARAAIIKVTNPDIKPNVSTFGIKNKTLKIGLTIAATDQPIGRFLYAPLQLSKSDPELFRLALEATAEDEIAAMRRGEKILETVIALAPLLGLLGTVLGLIQSLGSLRLGDLGTAAAAGVTTGIGESLISTASGLVVAIFSLSFYRLFQAFVVNQVKIFRRAGSDLELLYRQYGHNPSDTMIMEGSATPQPGVSREAPARRLFVPKNVIGNTNKPDHPEPPPIIHPDPGDGP